jgi:chaperonin cofactor prefoldin
MLLKELKERKIAVLENRIITLSDNIKKLRKKLSDAIKDKNNTIKVIRKLKEDK